MIEEIVDAANGAFFAQEAQFWTDKGQMAIEALERKAEEELAAFVEKERQLWVAKTSECAGVEDDRALRFERKQREEEVLQSVTAFEAF